MMSAGAPAGPSGKLYVGRLPLDVSRRELEDMFCKYGQIVSIEVKHGGYAFIEFDNEKDAEDALNRLNGTHMDGGRITVEWSRRGSAAASNCYNCNKPGHWARDCPESKEVGMDVRSGKCFKCGDFGHLARFCRIGNDDTYDRKHTDTRRDRSDRRDRDSRDNRDRDLDRRRTPSPRSSRDRRRSRSPRRRSSASPPAPVESSRRGSSGRYDDREYGRENRDYGRDDRQSYSSSRY